MLTLVVRKTFTSQVKALPGVPETGGGRQKDPAGPRHGTPPSAQAGCGEGTRDGFSSKAKANLSSLSRSDLS